MTIRLPKPPQIRTQLCPLVTLDQSPWVNTNVGQLSMGRGGPYCRVSRYRIKWLFGCKTVHPFIPLSRWSIFLEKNRITWPYIPSTRTLPSVSFRNTTSKDHNGERTGRKFQASPHMTTEPGVHLSETWLIPMVKPAQPTPGECRHKYNYQDAWAMWPDESAYFSLSRFTTSQATYQQYSVIKRAVIK